MGDSSNQSRKVSDAVIVAIVTAAGAIAVALINHL